MVVVVVVVVDRERNYVTLILCIIIIISRVLQSRQCFEAVGWAAGRASGL